MGDDEFGIFMVMGIGVGIVPPFTCSTNDNLYASLSSSDASGSTPLDSEF